MTNVPLIDVAPARHGGRDERCRVAAAIDGACREIGFFAISGHGVPDRLVDDLRRLAHDFFGLPLADKLRCRHPVEGTNRGYHPVGCETLSKANDAAAPPDLKEFFHVGPVDTTADSYYTGSRGRRPLDRRADVAHDLRRQHRRSAHAMDERSLAVQPAPRREPAARSRSERPTTLDRVLQSSELRRPHRVPSLARAAETPAGALG